VHRGLSRGQVKDQPAAARVEMFESKDAVEKGAVGVRVRAEEDDMGTEDHLSSLLPVHASVESRAAALGRYSVPDRHLRGAVVAGGRFGVRPDRDDPLRHTAGVLPGLVSFVLAVGLALVSIGRLVAPRTRPASLAQAGAASAVALAGLGTLAYSGLRDDAVEVGGDTTYWQPPSARILDLLT
jgi:hypothetical protein